MEKFFIMRNGRACGFSKKMSEELTQAEYEALPEEVKNNGTEYHLTDVGQIWQNGVMYGGIHGDYQEKLVGEEGQMVGFDTDGNAKPIDVMPVYATTSSNNDSRITLTTTSLKIELPFKRAIITLSNLYGGMSVNGGYQKIELIRDADGTYRSFGQAQPIIIPQGENKIRYYYQTASASVGSDGTITKTVGGGYADIDLAAGTVSTMGTGGGAGNFYDVIVWF